MDGAAAASLMSGAVAPSPAAAVGSSLLLLAAGARWASARDLGRHPVHIPEVTFEHQQTLTKSTKSLPKVG